MSSKWTIFVNVYFQLSMIFWHVIEANENLTLENSMTIEANQRAVKSHHASTQKLWNSKTVSTAQANYYHSMLGASPITQEEKMIRKLSLAKFEHLRKQRKNQKELPEEFDARKKWPQCESIWKIQDQSRCGSCWAVGPTSAITDRICIATNGKKKPQISAKDILDCYMDGAEDGCEGGSQYTAWQYWISSGLVSGGSYLDKTGCQPYPFPPCSDRTQKFSNCHQRFKTDKCKKDCQSSYGRKYSQDKYYGQELIYLPTVEAIQQELFERGPVTVRIVIYEDFHKYSDGIYHHQDGNKRGGHIVKLIGWGQENGVKYWLLANSWNVGWGMNGFFKVLRGTNEASIEENAVAAIFDEKRSTKN